MVLDLVSESRSGTYVAGIVRMEEEQVEQLEQELSEAQIELQGILMVEVVVVFCSVFPISCFFLEDGRYNGGEGEKIYL